MATAQTNQTAPVIRTPDQRLRVFVSSTLEELSEERAGLRQAIEDLHLTPVMFELGASPHPPRALYRAYLEQSHVFVGIYWQRYGWVAPEMEVSGLEDEYLLSDGKPRLIYFKEPAEAREEEMTEFVRRIKSDGHSFRKFRSTDELAHLLRDDLAHLLTERFESVGARDAIEPAARPSSLPVPVTRLVGRDRDIEGLEELLSWEDVRLVTLTGVGGIGKSRLALEVATRARAIADLNVFFVDLTLIRDPDLLPRAIASALGVVDHGDRPLGEALIDHLRDSRALLLLDNFEQIVEAASFVSELLQACPNVKALVTSRTLLDVRGEHHWEMTPLAIPVNGNRAELDALASSPAVELFVERAQGADPKFCLTETNGDQVAELCVRLEGLPLALELTAAYVRFLPPAAMLERFDQRLDLEGHADHPQRQRTLRATIDWSYGLLADDERRLFARLAVFEGGWDLAAAQAICQPGCDSDVVQTLSHLVDNSLVAIADRPEGEPRFRMLETVREYARERLAETGDLAAVRSRHAEYFAELCAIARPHLHGPEHTKWMRRLDAEYPNIEALATWAIEDGDPELMLQAWGDVWVFLWMSARSRDVVAAAGRIDPVVGTLSLEARSRHAWLMGAAHYMLGEMTESATWLERSIPLLEESGEQRRHALALTMLGGALPYETRRDDLEEILVEAVERLRKLDDGWGLSIANAQLALVVLRDGRVDEAIEMHRESTEIARAMGNDFILELTLCQLAFDYLAKFDHQTARELLVECGEICQRIDSPEPYVLCLEGFAGVAYQQDNAAIAARLLGAAEQAREPSSISIWPLLEPMFVRAAATIRDAAGPELYEREMQAGQAMRLADALSLALAETAVSAA